MLDFHLSVEKYTLYQGKLCSLRLLLEVTKNPLFPEGKLCLHNKKNATTNLSGPIEYQVGRHLKDHLVQPFLAKAQSRQDGLSLTNGMRERKRIKGRSLVWHHT